MTDYAKIPLHEGKPKITAEMKGICIGEFYETITLTCPECAEDGFDNDCEVCGGSMEYEQKVPISWTTMKEIYKMMAEAAIQGFNND